jgi:hypothetical protein
MAYPEWVSKHKVKGTYVNFVNGKYYLYAAHSERISGTKRVKRVCDGYLGRITEQDGLIPPKDKVSSEICVYEFGLCCTILQLCNKIHKGFIKTSPKNADYIMVSSILNVIYGMSNCVVFNRNYLSILFPSLDVNKTNSESVTTDIIRGIAMINDSLNKLMGENRLVEFSTLAGLYKIYINEKWYFSKEDENILALKKKYKLKWEI